jgi:hypothetical protein
MPSLASCSTGRLGAVRNISATRSSQAIADAEGNCAGCDRSTVSCRRSARSASRGAVHIAISSVSEMTGKRRAINSSNAVNCRQREGNSSSVGQARVRHTCADHAAISESPRTSQTQLRRVSTFLAIVLETGHSNRCEGLKKL